MTGRPVNASSSNALAGGSAELRLALPSRTLAVAVGLACFLMLGFWSAGVALGPWGMPEFTSGATGIGIMAALAGAGLLVLTPWKQRAMIDWMTVWLGATVFRLLVTPIVVYLIYSAASTALVAKPLGLAVSLTYLATLFVEAAIIARHVKAVSDQQSAIGHGHRSP